MGIIFRGTAMERTGAAGKVAFIGELETGNQRNTLPEDLSPNKEIKKIKCSERAANSIRHDICNKLFAVPSFQVQRVKCHFEQSEKS